MIVTEIDLATLSSLPAICCALASLDIEGWYPRAGTMCAALVAGVNHSALSMLPTVHRFIATFVIKRSWLRASK